MRREKVAFDIDGVIQDFFTPFLTFVNAKLRLSLSYEDAHCHDLGKCFGIPHEMMVGILSEFNSEFPTRNIEAIPGAIEHLQILGAHYDLAVITSRQSELEGCTKQWFDENLPHMKEIHFSLGRNNPYVGGDGRVHKPKIAEMIGAFCLIEDNEQEFPYWDSNIVVPICYAQPWNRSISESHPQVFRGEWPEITKFLLERKQLST